MEKETKVVKIDPEGKYILVFEHPLTDIEIDQLQRRFREWVNSNSKFLFLGGDIQLEKVGENNSELTIANELDTVD